jgi:hypothetical protein
MWSTSLDDALWDVVGAVGQLTESTDPSAAFVVRTTDVDRCDLEHAGATLTDAACWDIRMLDSDAF